MTVPSWIFVRSPIRMVLTSPRMTTFIQTLLSCADLDVPDDLGALVDVRGRMDLREDGPERAKHGGIIAAGLADLGHGIGPARGTA